MDDLFDGLKVLVEQLVRLLQLVGLPIFTVLIIVGFLLLLTSGKNPRRKKMGYVFVVIFGSGALLIAYAPLIAHSFVGVESQSAHSGDSVENMVNGAGSIGPQLFKGVWFVSIPIVFTMFYFGLLVRLSAAKNPQKKRLGLGMMLFSPIVLLAAYIMPKLVQML
ncbi:hypothetical protein IAQ67_14390 [Paenibacillus peoriae]|uniref:Uncharacterized protein n=1 Tax=Paenibacillus peoriae TaxID=59893 RepID=A0A7H0Y201_9BACL|nr:hypothetical protein [Paenibacillus peoriae]QNR65109.1 hypothetical protein IAQ67_14390 [Paenibacillus peoriae]